MVTSNAKSKKIMLIEKILLENGPLTARGISEHYNYSQYRQHIKKVGLTPNEIKKVVVASKDIIRDDSVIPSIYYHKEHIDQSA